MDSPSKIKGSPAMPLFPLSPERVNRTRAESSSSNTSSDVKRRARAAQNHAPPSPTLSAFDSPPKHTQNANAGVEGMVARFNALEIRDHAEMRRKDAAALKRAQMGREEAESDLKKAREELRRLKKEVDDGSDRERKLTKRVEVVSDELTRARDTQMAAQNLYEKEIRRARKEAFKSSSALVKLQEDLKAARASLSKTRIDLDTERGRARQRDQDAFASQYELVGVQEALQKERERCMVIESERDALKTQLKEEEVARVAAEGMIALPAATPKPGEGDEFASPKKKRDQTRTPSGRAKLQDVMVSQLQAEMQDLRQTLDNVQYAKEEAEQQVDFMKMECQFRCCSCRVADQHGEEYVHDASLRNQIFAIRPESRLVMHIKVDEDEHMKEPDELPAAVGEIPSRGATPPPAEQDNDIKEDVIFSPQSGTFRKSIVPSEMQPEEEQAVDFDHVTVSRPTVYINANGHAHELEHQEHLSASPQAASPHDHEDPHDETVLRTQQPDLDDLRSDDPNHFHDDNHSCIHSSAPSPTVHPEAQPEPTHPLSPPTIYEDPLAKDDDDDDDENNHDPSPSPSDDEEDEEEADYLIESPTTRIAATTTTTTVPLAPLSSPVKQAPPTPAPAASISVHDFCAAPRATPPSDKENAPPGSAVAAADPWTPLPGTGLSREQAIERLRERRERERARSTAAGGDGATPLRAASQGGSTAAKRAVGAAVGRRDVSAPEVRGQRVR